MSTCRSISGNVLNRILDSTHSVVRVADLLAVKDANGRNALEIVLQQGMGAGGPGRPRGPKGAAQAQKGAGDAAATGKEGAGEGGGKEGQKEGVAAAAGVGAAPEIKYTILGGDPLTPITPETVLADVKANKPVRRGGMLVAHCTTYGLAKYVHVTPNSTTRLSF